MSNEPQADASVKSQSAEEISRRAWNQFAKKEYVSAISTFREALTTDADHLEAVYGFALALRYKGEQEGAVKAFEQVLKLIEGGAVSDQSRIEMLERLAKAHLTYLKEGAATSG